MPATAFAAGAVVPLGAVLLAVVQATVVSAIVALSVIGGTLAMLISAVIGRLLGTVV